MMDMLWTVLVVALIAILIRMRRDRSVGRDGRGPQLQSVPFRDGAEGEFLVRKRSQN